MNLGGDDDIRDHCERGGNQHGPLARIVGTGDCDLIHGVEVTGACRCWDALAVETNQVKVEGTGQLGRLSRGRCVDRLRTQPYWVT